MNGRTLVDRVRETERTELDRLGSDKAMIAATGADLAAGPVLEHVALALDGLRATYEAWAAETDHGDARAAFAAAAEDASREYEDVVAHLDGEPGGDPPAGVAALDAFDDTVERVAGGLVGQPLAFDRTLLQAVNVFVNEADERRADLVRDVRTGANDRVEEGATVLDGVCTGDADWERASAAASEVVEAAYAEYVERLDDLGIDPKPVC